MNQATVQYADQSLAEDCRASEQSKQQHRSRILVYLEPAKTCLNRHISCLLFSLFSMQTMPYW